MKLEDIQSEEMVAQYIEGCINDLDAGISTKVETSNLIMGLVIHMIKLDRRNKWRSVDKMPCDSYVIIKTKTGTIRIAKQTVYPDSSRSIHYSGTYFKDVIGWQPLPQ